VGGEILRTRPHRFWGPPSHLYNGYLVFPGSKVAGAWRWPPTPTSAEVKERVELTSTPTLGLRGLLQGELHCVIRLTKPILYRTGQFCGILLGRNLTYILCFFKYTAYIMLKIFWKFVTNLTCIW